MRRLIAGALAGLFAPLYASAASLPPPVPHQTGVVRIWGAAQMAPLAQRWAAGLRAQRPDLRVETYLTGSDVALAGLYTGKVDIALVGRDATEVEVKAFEWIYRYRPTGVVILHGGIDRPGRSPALAILTHRSNPLSQISLDQLRAVFGADGAPVRTWGQLGLKGAWAARPIHLYAPDMESGSGRFFRHVVLADSSKLNWDALREFAEPVGGPGHVDQAARRIAAAVARDPQGLGIGLSPAASQPIKALAVARAADGPYFRATPTTVVSRAYPLSRDVNAYFNRAPGSAADPGVKAFLDYVLSPAGQAELAKARGYLPLSADDQSRSRAALD